MDVWDAGISRVRTTGRKRGPRVDVLLLHVIQSNLHPGGNGNGGTRDQSKSIFGECTDKIVLAETSPTNA